MNYSETVKLPIGSLTVLDIKGNGVRIFGFESWGTVYRNPGTRQDWRQTCLEMKNAAEDLVQEILGIAPVIREIQTYGVTKKIGLQYGLR